MDDIDISGVWDYSWNGNPLYVERHAYTPIPPNEFAMITRVRFVREKDPSCFQYVGSYYYRELPARSDPNWPYNSRWHVRIMPSTSDNPVYQFPILSIIQDGYSSEKGQRDYDSHEAGCGFLRDHTHPLWERDRIMWGIIYSNNGDNAVWLFRYNNEESQRDRNKQSINFSESEEVLKKIAQGEIRVEPKQTVEPARSAEEAKQILSIGML